MDFDLNEDQRLLKDTLVRFFKDNYSFEQRKQAMAMAGGWSQDVWKQLAELGFTGLLAPEAAGGFNGGQVEAMVAMEAMGEALLVEPLFVSALLGGFLLRQCPASAQISQLEAAMVGGTARLAVAFMEAEAPLDGAHVTTSARTEGGKVVLNGAKTLVLHGDSATHIIVSARHAGTPGSHHGIGLYLVEGDAAGLRRRGYATQDGQRAAELNFHETPAHVLNPEAYATIAKAIDFGMACICVEAVGAMSALHAMTVDYLKIRKQFGLPIGAFQVLQHRAVDMLVALEQARSLALVAMFAIDEKDAARRHRTVAAAKVQVARSGKFVGEEAIQLHGGIGMTMEYAAGHYFKRLKMIDVQWGDGDHHLAELARGPNLLEDETLG
ncbi:MAG: acyl-CoA dehydrogenase family protein [Hyphomicrobiales bacterium]|nr:acyl-CoA dehydrogenase family protein [Hyphomicrobiales bacterium]